MGTLRAEHDSFAISGERLPKELLHALAQVKGAAAKVNATLGELDAGKAAAIGDLVREVLAGRFVTGHETTTNLIGDGVATFLIDRGFNGRIAIGGAGGHEVRSFCIRSVHARPALSTRAGVQRCGLLAGKRPAVGNERQLRRCGT